MTKSVTPVPLGAKIAAAAVNLLSGYVAGVSVLTLLTAYFTNENNYDLISGFSASDALLIQNFRKFFVSNVWLFVVCAVLGIVLYFSSLIFMLCAAGRTRSDGEIGGYRENLVDRVPYDLYLVIIISLGTLAVLLTAATGSYCFDGHYNFNGSVYIRTIPEYTVPMLLTLMSVAAFALLALLLDLLSSTATRIKCRTLFSNTVTWRLIRLVWRAAAWLFNWIRRICGDIGSGIRYFFESLPTSWYAVAALAVYLLVNLILLPIIFWGSAFIGVILFIAFNGFCFWLTARLAMSLKGVEKAGEAIADGNMSFKLDTSGMRGPVKAHAENLNRISDGVAAAVERQMKSERFKTELITNVSHDIKTPITSIINYVGLLKAESTDNPKIAEYVEVLDRQSKRLKKLTEDVLEASKASSGAIEVNLSRLDVGELVSQCVGEYGERLEAAGLEAVCDIGSELYAVCDGRLMWRVFDNLLGNVVKYAQTGTRVYIEAAKSDSAVSVVIKNISKSRLNIPGDELMERFVRGDISRSTEGSGLGLSIANSLLSLQNSKLILTIDGDLFKADVVMGYAAF